MVSFLDSFHIMIVCKYFNSFNDFVQLMIVSKKYKDIVTQFHYNPIPLTFNTLHYFTHLETLHLYSHEDQMFPENTFYARVYHYIQVNVITLVGKTIIVYVHNLATVLDLKTEIEKSENITTCQQRIIFNNKLLQNDVKLHEVGIVDKSNVRLVLALKKPVILLYDSSASEGINSTQKVDIKIELCNSVFSCLYPTPQNVDENNKKCIWSAFYTSKQHSKYIKNSKEDDNLILEINNKKFEYLFWEAETYNTFDGEKYVAKNIEEVREVLDRLGLNTREQNDFIVYWVKSLQRYKKMGIV
ncbi:hypothetical protein EIN_124990, partial [Entamoeba invadens IP1]